MRKFLFGLLFFLLAQLVSAQAELKVMSYNIRLDLKSDGDNWWEKRKGVLTTMVNYHEPDFFGAQEVVHNQLIYLKDSLNGYDFIGVGRDDGKEAGEYSCIFYKKEKFAVIEQKTFWLSPTPDTPSKGWDAALNRVCTYGLFMNKKTKEKFWVFNTHFDHIGKQARLESAKLIVARVNKVNKKNYAVIITGDFNSKPEEEPATYMNSQMWNTRNMAKIVHGPADTWNAFHFDKKPEGCIDYIFAAPNKYLSVSKFATITDSYDMKYPSDHFPILATIIIDK